MRLLSKPMYLAFAALFLVGVSAQASFIVDHFVAPPGGQDVCSLPGGFCPAASDSSTFTTTTAADLLLGGSRYLQVLGSDASVSASAGGHFLSFSTNVGIQGWGYVLWNGSGITDNASYNFPKDFTQGGLNSKITLRATGDLVGGFLTLRVTDTSVNQAEVTKAITFTGLGNLSYLFSEFAGVDFANVGSVELGINGAGGLFSDASEDFDASIDVVEVADGGVPEPATLSLIGVGLLALGFFRKRLA